MSVVRIRGLKRYRHPKTGIYYTYHRPSGIRLEPPHQFGSPAFFRALADAEARHATKEPRAGTFGALVRSYRDSPAFLTLKERTRSDYHKALDWLRGIDGMPLAEIDSPFVAEVRDKAFRQKKRRFANYVLSVLSVLFGHGIEKGLVNGNPAKGVRKLKRPLDTPIANRAWTVEEKKVVLETAPPHLRLPIAIARWTGLREGDIIKLGKTAYANGILTLVTQKRGVPATHLCPTPLRELLDRRPPSDAITLCSNSRGRPWTASGFRASFFKLLKRLEQQGHVEAGLTFHGLRTSFAEELRSKGLDLQTIADALAHKDTRATAGYVRNADRRASMQRALEALEGTNEAQNLSTSLSTSGTRGQRR